MKHIILFGPPGCGKGTQAKIIKNNFGFIHLSTGMIFRKHIEKNTEIGKIVNNYIINGKLVPDIITTDLFNIEIKKYFKAKGIIYDGYPRTKNQIFSLENILKKFSLGNIDIIFYFLIHNKNIIINRLLKRGKKDKRNDDNNIMVVKKRIKEYEEKISFIWQNKKWKNYLVKVKASLPIDNISFFIKKKIYDLLKKKN